MPRALLLMVLALFEPASSAEWRVYNPDAVPVSTIHVVFSSHFDAGCKTPGCTAQRLPGEPDRCATVGASNGGPTYMGEPYTYHIINRYLDEFIPKAVRYAQQARASTPPLSYSSPVFVATTAEASTCRNGRRLTRTL